MLKILKDIMSITSYQEAKEVYNKYDRLANCTYNKDENKLEGNYSFIGNEPNNSAFIQDGRPTHGLVETITNAYDGVLLKYLDKLSNTKRKEILNKYDNYKQRFHAVLNENDKDINSMEDEIHLVITEGKDNNKYSIYVIDRGIGQPNNKIWSTFCSIGKDNKASNPYTIGIFSQGGTISLKHTCRDSFYNLKVIATKIKDKPWSYTLQRNIDIFNRRSPSFIYSHNNTKRNMPTTNKGIKEFAPELKNVIGEMEQGTIIKLPNYRLDSDKYLKSGSVDDLKRHLFCYLLDIPFGFTITDLRNNKTTVYNGEHNHAISNNVLFEFDKPKDTLYSFPYVSSIDINFLKNKVDKDFYNPNNNYNNPDDLGKVKIKVNLYKENTPDDITNQNYGLNFTLDGQSHHNKSMAMFRGSNSDYSRILNKLSIDIDFTNIDDTLKGEIFTSDRDKLIDNDVSEALMEKILETINNMDILYRAEEILQNKNKLDSVQINNLMSELINELGYENDLPINNDGNIDDDFNDNNNKKDNKSLFDKFVSGEINSDFINSEKFKETEYSKAIIKQNFNVNNYDKIWGSFHIQGMAAEFNPVVKELDIEGIDTIKGKELAKMYNEGGGSGSSSNQGTNEGPNTTYIAYFKLNKKIKEEIKKQGKKLKYKAKVMLHNKDDNGKIEMVTLGNIWYQDNKSIPNVQELLLNDFKHKYYAIKGIPLVNKNKLAVLEYAAGDINIYINKESNLYSKIKSITEDSVKFGLSDKAKKFILGLSCWRAEIIFDTNNGENLNGISDYKPFEFLTEFENIKKTVIDKFKRDKIKVA